MHPLVRHRLLDRHRRLRKHPVGRVFVAGLPGENVIVMGALAVGAGIFAGQVVAYNRCVRRQRLMRVDHGGKLFVFHLDQLDRVGSDVAVVRDHHRHFLLLKPDLEIGQHRLHVARQGRHPMQLERLEVVRHQYREHPGQRQRFILLDRFDARVRIRTAHEVGEYHARKLDVVDVVALPLNEARVFLALARVSHAADFILAFERLGRCTHRTLLRLISFWRRRTAPP